MDRFERIFHHARRLPQEERFGYLAKACEGDSALRREVESLLAQLDDDGSEFLSDAAMSAKIDVGAFAASQEPIASDPPTIGNYRVLRKIGEGGMGVVYLAEQVSTRRRVALKVIAGMFTSPTMIRRFEHEAQALGRLRHPGIAQVYEAGVADDETTGRTLPYIAMELVEGLPILEHAAQGDLSLEQRLDLMIRVCDAVHHAHQHGVIHRDLKPANILVEEHNEVAPTPERSTVQAPAESGEAVASGHDVSALGRLDVCPKVIDFGIARIIDADLRTTMHTRTGQLIGTLAYMSPEQAAGDPAAVDERTDVYALGVVLYELIAGKPPLDLPDPAAPPLSIIDCLRIIRDDDAVPLSSIDRRYRGDLTTIVGKALEKDRNRRYRSARELGEELSRYLRDEPIVAHRPSATYQLRKFARRNRTFVAAATAVALVLAAATVISTMAALRATAAQQHAERQQERAEEHLADAHQLARTMLFEIDDSLVNVAGALPARKLLVERGLAYLDKLAQQAGDDPALLHELATGYVIIGDVQGDTQRPNIGDLDGSLDSYRMAIEILEEHIDRMEPQAHVTLYLALNKVGDQLAQRNDFVGAAGYYEESAAIATDMNNRRDLGEALARLADVLIALGREDEAAAHRAEALRITEELIAENPDDIRLKRNVAVRHFERGLQFLDTDAAAALAEFEAFVSICEELTEADPDHAVYQRDVAIGAQRMGHALEALGRKDEALPLYERELAIMERLAAADPENYQARTGVAAPCCKIGEIYLDRGDLETSLRHFQRYLDVSFDCAAENPSDAAIQRDVGVAYYKLNQWHAAHADDETRPPAERIEHGRMAGEWLARCRDHFIMMRETGLLRPVDAGVPEVIEAELLARDKATAQLNTN